MDLGIRVLHIKKVMRGIFGEAGKK